MSTHTHIMQFSQQKQIFYIHFFFVPGQSEARAVPGGTKRTHSPVLHTARKTIDGTFPRGRIPAQEKRNQSKVKYKDYSNILSVHIK